MLAILPFTGYDTGDGEALALLFSNYAQIQTVCNVIPMTRNALDRVNEEKRNSKIDSPLTIDYVMIGMVREVRNNFVLIIDVVDRSTTELLGGSALIYRDPADLQSQIPRLIDTMITAIAKDRTGRAALVITPFATPQPGVSANEAEVCTLLLATAISNTASYRILPRLASLNAGITYVNEITSAKNDVVPLGSIERVLTCSVITLGNRNLFMAQVLRIADNSVEKGAEEAYDVASNDGLLRVIPLLARKLTGADSLLSLLPAQNNTQTKTGDNVPTAASSSYQTFTGVLPSGAASSGATPTGGSYRPSGTAEGGIRAPSPASTQAAAGQEEILLTDEQQDVGLRESGALLDPPNPPAPPPPASSTYVIPRGTSAPPPVYTPPSGGGYYNPIK
jgi:hypothetical protein